jgi:hypothetical protein
MDVDPVSAGLGVAVATLLAKAWERASDRAVEGAEGVVTRLVARLRRRFTDKGDEAGSGALALLEQAPDSARARDGLAAAVDRQIASDTGFGDELAGLIEEAGRAGLVAGPATQTAWGTGIAQVQNTQGSVSIHQDRPGPA